MSKCKMNTIKPYHLISHSHFNGKKDGLRDMNITIFSKIYNCTAKPMDSKNISKKPTRNKFILSPLVILAWDRWNDLFCKGKRRWTRLWLSSNGAGQEEIQMEKNEFYHWFTQKTSFCNLCRSVSHASSSNLRELKCLVSYACSYTILLGKKCKWKQWVYSLPCEISRS